MVVVVAAEGLARGVWTGGLVVRPAVVVEPAAELRDGPTATFTATGVFAGPDRTVADTFAVGPTADVLTVAETPTVTGDVTEVEAPTDTWTDAPGGVTFAGT